ncbi:dissimilatory sulfite reductase D family protein [uncultured Pseudodesulfovibrio sp.]|uniref:dissimilatory sulfite reductase D family protein n=1 Tax=uncultured Pseudodesulfovibrio sp. TaxID=2035858 RepID=UPI0029C788D8|nr:dissimilatory sulfite reductase D family protein [uncultured Pseudodesulfovibrio sp.]
MEAAKAEILGFCESKSANKSKFYFNDFTKLFPDAKAREVKKILTALIQEEKLVFWSSGSTTMYGMAGAGKQAASEGED